MGILVFLPPVFVLLVAFVFIVFYTGRRNQAILNDNNDYNQQISFFWHVHPRRLLEGCYNYYEHATFIRTEKPPREQELRLRLFQPVRGQLPQEVVEAMEAYVETGKACDEVEKASIEVGKAHDELRKPHNRARRDYENAWREWFNSLGARSKVTETSLETGRAHGKAVKAYFEALSNHKDEIEALHAQECLNCPWDGKTIFPAA